MSQHSTGRSDIERGKRTPSARQLLYTRAQTAELLGNVSLATIRRLENEGLLKPVRLSRSPTAMVFFRASDVEALVAGAADATSVSNRKGK